RALMRATRRVAARQQKSIITSTPARGGTAPKPQGALQRRYCHRPPPESSDHNKSDHSSSNPSKKPPPQCKSAPQSTAAAPTSAPPAPPPTPAAGWVAEGADITRTDPDVDELVVTPRKCAALVKIWSELGADSSPAAAQVVGDGLVRDLARKVDQA